MKLTLLFLTICLVFASADIREKRGNRLGQAVMRKVGDVADSYARIHLSDAMNNRLRPKMIFPPEFVVIKFILFKTDLI